MKTKKILFICITALILFLSNNTYALNTKKYEVKFSKKGQNHYTTIDANTKAEAEKLIKIQYGNDIVIWTVTEIK